MLETREVTGVLIMPCVAGLGGACVKLKVASDGEDISQLTSMGLCLCFIFYDICGVLSMK